MKLLVCTQKVDINDDVLGFMHGWIAEFAKQCEQVTVICLYKGEYNLPENVKVLSLGKEKILNGYMVKLLYGYKFYKYIIQERKNYDSVFVHMNQVYILLGWKFWKLWRKRIALWYAHGSTNLSLRLAVKLSDIVFTSTRSGCRLKSKKIKIIGQGIDIDKFKVESYKVKSSNKFKIITVGRISPSKDYKTLIKAVEILCGNAAMARLQIDIIGDIGLLEQQAYLDELKKLVKEKGLDEQINFIGPVPNKDIVSHLQLADLFVNMSQTGSLDKTMVEAMACGLPVLTCNEAMAEVLGDYKDKLMYPLRDHEKLAQKIKEFMEMDLEKKEKLCLALREMVVEKHSLKSLVKQLISSLTRNT